MRNSSNDRHKLTLGQLLAKVSRLVGERMRMKLERIGLQHAQGTILFHLWHQDGIAQNVLAKTIHIRPPTATSTLQRMQRDGWVERRRDGEDQRIVRVHLTEKAKALGKETHATFRQLDQEMASVLTDQEREMFMKILSKVHRHLVKKRREVFPQQPCCDDGRENP